MYSIINVLRSYVPPWEKNHEKKKKSLPHFKNCFKHTPFPSASPSCSFSLFTSIFLARSIHSLSIVYMRLHDEKKKFFFSPCDWCAFAISRVVTPNYKCKKKFPKKKIFSKISQKISYSSTRMKNICPCAYINV